ncbi:MAG: hypothetical protein HYT97_09740 [Elusimicrobia bacterium]|nr:hypothetical protein [Elusimicrobiota bacterium]
MRKLKLSKQESEIEKALVSGEYIKIDHQEFEEIAQAISHRKKDSVLNIRVNSEDLKNIKQKANRLGVKYQTFVSELLHQVAHS